MPLSALLREIREIFLVAKSMEQSRSSQLKSADFPLVRIHLFGVPYMAVSKVWTFIAPLPRVADRS